MNANFLQRIQKLNKWQQQAFVEEWVTFLDKYKRNHTDIDYFTTLSRFNLIIRKYERGM